jgi:hypothetical protein
MSSEMLEVGQVLYSYQKYGRGLSSKVTVQKVTPTQAVLSNNAKVKRGILMESWGEGRKYVRSIGEHDHYYLENDNLKSLFSWTVLHKRLKGRIATLELESLSFEELSALSNALDTIIPQKQTP